MTSWLAFACVFALFFVTHSVPVRPPVKRRLVAHLGPRGFTLAYALLSLVMLALLIWATQRAPFVSLWAEAPWHRPVIWLGMFAACVIFAVAIGRPNPFSFGGSNNDAFNPSAPGVVAYLRHPLLSAMALWAILHMVMNGDLAHVLLFGTLAFFAIMGHRIVDKRKKRVLGPENWAQLWAKTRKGRRLSLPSRGFIIRACIGGGVYILLVVLHPIVIGLPVFL